MFGEFPISDAARFMKACATNQVARLAPRHYVRLTEQTGRGASDSESSRDIAEYFLACFREYFEILGVAQNAVDDYLRGKHVLEYGPGDLPGVAVLMVAHGADHVTCVDRFPLVSLSDKNIDVMRVILKHLEGDARQRAVSCFRNGDPRQGLHTDRIAYLVTPSGLSGLHESADLIVSRAVLEHVNDLAASFDDMRVALRKTGVAVHQVDLKSHGLHRRNRLDFLTWPKVLWDLMYSCKGVPNRWRVDRYREILAHAGLEPLLLQPTLCATPEEISEVRPHLAGQFKRISDEDLSWLGFWLMFRK